MIENDYDFLCPYCSAELSVRLDVTAGKHQEFIQDCETCCRPIQIRATFASGKVLDFSSERMD